MDKNKMIDFITDKIFEESKDATEYTEWASQCNNSNVKSTLLKIAEDETVHQKLLVKLLSDMAKRIEE